MEWKPDWEFVWEAPVDKPITDLKVVSGKVIATIENVEYIVPNPS